MHLSICVHKSFEQRQLEGGKWLAAAAEQSVAGPGDLELQPAQN